MTDILIWQKMSDVEFLRLYLRKQQVAYETLQELEPQDLFPPGDGPPQTSEDDMRCACIAYQHGFDVIMFWNLFSLSPHTDPVDFSILLNRYYRRIMTIPRIIAAIERGISEWDGDFE